jgi:hypothetical protein
MLDREVTWVPTEIVTDARGNEERVDGTPVPGIRACRELVAVAEDVADDDQQSRTFLYFLAPTVLVDGSPVLVEPTGRDRIEDGADTFELRGLPEVEAHRRRRKRHHVEAVAYLIEG